MCSRQPNNSFVAVLETGVSETNSDSKTLALLPAQMHSERFTSIMYLVFVCACQLFTSCC